MNRKAIMGIGTLIIFIATILVAAVAAGVIISTSGVLQQKALLIGEQSRNRLINGIQITHIFMAGNTTEKTANNVEILSRPEPASGPINMKTTTLTFFTNNGSYAASLAHIQLQSINITISTNVDTSFTAFGDLDEDGLQDFVRTVDNGGGNSDAIQFNMSETGLTDAVSLGVDITSSGVNVNLTDLPITGNGTVYGYVHIEDDSTAVGGELDANTVRVTDEFEGECTFAKLRPETRYCLVTLTGTDDTALEYGETVFIYFKLMHENRLYENDEFEIKVFPQDGRSTFILDRVPQVIYKTRMSVYP